jgi:hypothetical protein
LVKACIVLCEEGKSKHEDIETYIERVLHVCWELNGELESCNYFLNGVE